MAKKSFKQIDENTSSGIAKKSGWSAYIIVPKTWAGKHIKCVLDEKIVASNGQGTNLSK